MLGEAGKPVDATQQRGRAAAVTITLVVFTLLALLVGIRLLGSGGLLPHRIVVGAQGCGGECDRMLAQQLAQRLSSVGFDAVAPHPEGGFAGPEAVRSFAGGHGARFAVMLVVGIERAARISGAHGSRVDANAALYVMDASDRAAPEPSYMVRSVEEGDDESTARSLLARRFLDAIFPVSASTLLSTETVQTLIAEAGSMEQQAAALTMKKRARDVQARAQAIRDYQLHCEANDASLAAQPDAQCVSAGCAEEYLVGILPDGSAAVVHDSTNTPVFPLTPDSTARSFLDAERLWLVPRRGPRKLLVEAANFYSWPHLSRDGTMLAFIERRHGRSRLYTLSLEDRTRTLVASAEPPAYLSMPRLSPDGSRLLYYRLVRRHGSAALFTADSRGHAPARQLLDHALDARIFSLPGTDGGPPRPGVAALVPGAPDGPDGGPAFEIVDGTTGELLDRESRVLPELRLLDVEHGQEVGRVDRPAHRIRALGDVLEDALLLSWQDELRCGLARYVPGQPIEWIATDRCPRHVAVGDGGVYAHARGDPPRRPRQIYRIDLGSGDMQRMTRGIHESQRPRPATHARSFAYERVLPREYGELQHVAVCFGDAPRP
ncbi:MAG: hypothetical protein PVI30_08865 [Myxococcales bacterium]|jgi:hypothetical protein